MKKELKKITNEERFTFLPVEKLSNSSACPIGDRDLHNALPKGKYDIHYIINLCHTLIDKIDRYKTNPKDLPFTLTHSLKRLLCHLEVEKDQMK